VGLGHAQIALFPNMAQETGMLVVGQAR